MLLLLLIIIIMFSCSNNKFISLFVLIMKKGYCWFSNIYFFFFFWKDFFITFKPNQSAVKSSAVSQIGNNIQVCLTAVSANTARHKWRCLRHVCCKSCCISLMLPQFSERMVKSKFLSLSSDSNFDCNCCLMSSCPWFTTEESGVALPESCLASA